VALSFWVQIVIVKEVKYLIEGEGRYEKKLEQKHWRR
jgi:hypothetical protein